jgi:DNA-binding response OmpR family regulator
VLQVGDLEVDPAARRCRRAGKEVDLTGREFSLLEYLARHPGDVLSKQDIIRHVWDYDFEGDPNIVEVYVCRIRRKVDTPSGGSTIETVRGVGYRMVASGA